MARTIAALYDSRAEAEIARAHLVSELSARSPRIIAKDTLGAVDTLKIAPADVAAYREGLRRGGHLLVAEVPSGQPPKRITEGAEQAWGDGEQGIGVKLPDGSMPEEPPQLAEAPPPPQADEQAEPAPEPAEAVLPAAAAEDTSRPAPEEELRIGNGQMVPGRTRVRSVTLETPAEEEVSLREEFVEVQSRPCERHLSETEVEAGGLFKERTFEIAEMREEPVVTKTAVVREEVIVTKRVKTRSETIRETLRHTEVAVEDLATADDAPTFFGGRRNSR
jgi:stress response protein YsnF